MNYKNFNLGDWIGHISGVIEDETTLDGNEMRDLVEFLSTLEQKPYEKFENVKDHIYKLASDYKCWDNRLTDDEALELCHILEQEPFLNKPCVSSGVCEHDKNKVLDKIRAEIEQLTSRYTISRERGGMGQVEWSDMLIKESEVLQIIDKYKGESER